MKFDSTRILAVSANIFEEILAMLELPLGINKYLVVVMASLLSLILRFSLSRIPYLFMVNSGLFPRKLRHRLGWGIRRAVTFHPFLSKNFKTDKALILYFSISGNTEKVALAIQRGLRKQGLESVIKGYPEAFEEDLYDYDLLFLGTPVTHSLPPDPVMKFIIEKGNEYRKRGEVRIDQKPIPGKNALVFVTFSGPHIGIDEALPAGKYVRQFLEHIAFEVMDEWYVIGEFHGWKAGSTRGRLGDIRGRPNAKDLARIEEKTVKLVQSLRLEN